MFEKCAAYRRALSFSLPDDAALSKLDGRSVLITGATGLIGTFLVDSLRYARAERGVDVRAFAAARDVERTRARFAGSDVDVVPFDLFAPLAGDRQYDYIVHAASNAHPLAYAADPVGTLTGNVLGTRALLDYGRAHGMARLLYVSSGEVYGEAPEKPDGLTETDYGFVDPLSVRSCYPMGKRAAETLCACYAAQYGVDTAIARPCHTYGPTQTERDSRASAQFLRDAAAHRDIVLKSAGLQARAYLYGADCCSGIWTILLRGQSGAAYNLANPAGIVTIADFAAACAAAVGMQIRFEDPDAREAAGYTPIPRGVLNADKLQALGWTPRYTVEAGIAETLAILQAEVKP